MFSMASLLSCNTYFSYKVSFVFSTQTVFVRRAVKPDCSVVQHCVGVCCGILPMLIQGIRMLVAEGFLKETPEDVAAFLKDEEMLSKLKIGEYLGDQ